MCLALQEAVSRDEMIAEAPLVFIGRVEEVGGPEWAGGIPSSPELEGEELQRVGVAY